MDMSPSSTMSNSSMSMMSMSMMSMTFFTSNMTPLYSSAWQPTDNGTYAGTCIFLIVLAAILRGLLAVKGWRETVWLDEEYNRRFVAVAGKPTMTQQISSDSENKRMILTENGVEEEVMVVKKRSSNVRPWRLSVDPLRAIMDTVIAGVAYLLMLAVMTMNVGYFMSVLAGTFIGSLAAGRYAITYDQH